MLLGPKNFRPGARDDNARLQKLERQYADLLKRVMALEEAKPAFKIDFNDAFLEAGFKSVCFENLKRAVSYLTEKAAHVIVLGFQHSSEAGSELAQIRKLQFHKKTPVIAVDQPGESSGAVRPNQPALAVSKAVLKAVAVVQKEATLAEAPTTDTACSAKPAESDSHVATPGSVVSRSADLPVAQLVAGKAASSLAAGNTSAAAQPAVRPDVVHTVSRDPAFTVSDSASEGMHTSSSALHSSKTGSWT